MNSIKECKVCGEVPKLSTELIDGTMLASLVCKEGVCSSVDMAFTTKRAIEHWNAIQNTEDAAEIANIIKHYEDLEGHGIYQIATKYIAGVDPISSYKPGVGGTVFKLTFDEDYYKPLVEDMLVDTEQPGNLLLK